MQYILKKLTVELKPSKMLLGEVGLFAVRAIKKGEKVCVFSSNEDVFISKEEFAELSPEQKDKVLAFVWGRPNGFLLDKGLDFNNIPATHYVDHSCEGNLGFDADGDLVSLDAISQGSELFYDYGLVEANPDYSFDCRCGTASCRGRVTGLDWKDADFQTRNWDYMHPDLKALARA